MKTNRRGQKTVLFKLEDALYAAILTCPSLVSGLRVFTCKVMIFTCSSPGALPCEIALRMCGLLSGLRAGVKETFPFSLAPPNSPFPFPF